MDPVTLDEGRPQWRSATAFGLATVGAGAGIAGLLRLPYMFCEYGPSAFFIALVITILTVGWPVATLELFLGHFFRKSSGAALTHIHLRLRGVGVAAALCSQMIFAAYGSVMVAWLIYPYLSLSLTFDGTTANLTTLGAFDAYFQSNALFESPSNAPVFGALGFAWIVIGLLSARGTIRGVAVASFIAVPPALVLLLAFTAVAVVFTSGEAVTPLIIPTAEQFQNWGIWAHALGETFLLCGAGVGGVLVTFGSYARPVHNCSRIALATVSGVAILAAIVGVLTAAALAMLPQTQCPRGALHAAWLVYPVVVGRVNASWFTILSIALYVAIGILALEALASLVVGLMSTLRDHSVALRGWKAFFGIIFLLLIMSAPLQMRAAFQVVVALDRIVVGVVLPLLAVCECLAVGYLWGAPDGTSLYQSVATATRDSRGCFSSLLIAIKIAYNWSVVRMREVLCFNGNHHNVWGLTVLPLCIKFLIPLSCLVASIGYTIDVALAGSLESIVVLSSLPSVGVAIVLVGAATVSVRPAGLPWGDAVTLQAITGLGTPTTRSSTEGVAFENGAHNEADGPACPRFDAPLPSSSSGAAGAQYRGGNLTPPPPPPASDVHHVSSAAAFAAQSGTFEVCSSGGASAAGGTSPLPTAQSRTTVET